MMNSSRQSAPVAGGPASRFPATTMALRMLQTALGGLLFALTVLLHPSAHAETRTAKPTIVLVHGAFAESLSWEAVIERLLAKGYPVVAVANPLRGLRSDSAYVANLVDTIPGPVVMVGHSYGGAVISNAAEGKPTVKGLVFVAAFAPEGGEALGELGARFPGSTLGSALVPVALPGGGKELYVQRPSTARRSPLTFPSASQPFWRPRRGPSQKMRSSIARAALPGKSFLPGSSTGRPTGPSHRNCLRSWRDVPGRSTRLRSRAHRMPFSHRMPTRSLR